MVRVLRGSKFGEGSGGASCITSDPDAPSYDPATHKTTTDSRIADLLAANMVAKLTEWERNFLIGIYGSARLSRNQHIRVGRLHKQYVGEYS